MRQLKKNILIDIVIPVYNEEDQLEENIKKLNNFLIKNFKYNYKITIADNASTDNTLNIAKKLSKKYAHIGFITLDKKGRGIALRKAWNDSKADIVSYMDVDISTNLEAFLPMIDALVIDGYDVAVGSRLIEGSKIQRSLKREILSRFYNLLLRYFLGIKFKDAQCGFKSITKKVVDEIIPQVKDNEWFFDSELLFKAEREGLRIKEIPVIWIEDRNSKVKLFKTVLNYLGSILRLRFEFLKDIFHDVLKNPILNNFVRNVVATGQITIKNRIKRLIKNSDNVIEIGCGTGEFSKIVNGDYVGVDIEKSYIDYANKKFSKKNKKFVLMNGEKLDFKDKSFDTSLILSVLHHLNDKDVFSILKEAKRVTKKRVILVDLVPLKYNIIGKFFYAMDLGNYIRPLDQQLKLVSKVFKIKKVSKFRSGMNIHSLILCSIEFN